MSEELEKKGDERILEQKARFKDYGGAVNSEEESRCKQIRLDELRKTDKRDLPKNDVTSKEYLKRTKQNEQIIKKFEKGL